MKNIDENYRIIELTPITLNKTSYVDIYSISGKGYIDCIVFKLEDTETYLTIEVDGVNVINGFLLKNLNSVYKLSKSVDFDLPLTSIDDTVFRYKARVLHSFSSSFKVKLKHKTKNNKSLEGGYVAYQFNS